MTDWVRAKSIARSKRKRALQRMIVARSDIHASMRACQLMIDTVNHLGHDLYEPLYAAIVVCYARPFVENRTIGDIILHERGYSTAGIRCLRKICHIGLWWQYFEWDWCSLNLWDVLWGYSFLCLALALLLLPMSMLVGLYPAAISATCGVVLFLVSAAMMRVNSRAPNKAL